MSPMTYNLDRAGTKYLSNFAYPAPPPYLTGASLELAGWSTDSDGGFTFGESTPATPPLMSATYTGHGAVAIPNARNVQVGYLKEGANNYIVAAYYDNAVSLYGYSLYKWDLMAKTATFLYTLHFQDPNYEVPSYIPNTDCVPVIGGLVYPYYPPPSITSTMEYNRISMDINKDANEVVMVMTNDLNGFMYTTAGIISVDSIIFCPNLPPMILPPTICVSPHSLPTNVYPTPEFDYFSGTYSYVLNPATGDYDYFDVATGMYVRYYASLGSPATYHYSYYPIDEGIFITEFIRYSPTSTYLTNLPSPPKPPRLYAPLIRIKSVSAFTSPCSGPYYRMRYPDVAFGGENLFYVFYAVLLGDLYVNNNTSFPTSFSDLYTFGGGSIASFFCAGAGQTDYPMQCRNTADGKFISSYGPTGGIPGLESNCVSIVPTPPTTYFDLEVWANIDAPDLGGDKWAVTFAYTFDPAYLVGGTPFFKPGTATVMYTAADDFKHNIYVRSNYDQTTLTNGSMGNMPINTGENVSPTISFKPLGISNATVAWASKEAGLINGSNWGYIGAEINTTLPFGTTSPSSLVTINDYLQLSSNPADYCGDNPLVSLSKHTDGLSYLYSSYTQEDAAGTYSVLHKNKANGSTSYWRTSGIANTATNTSINVSPNPFSNSLHISCSEPLSLQVSDILGRTMGSYSGTADEVNKQLDALAPQLSTGTYILKANSPNGTNEIFKLTKQ